MKQGIKFNGNSDFKKIILDLKTSKRLSEKYADIFIELGYEKVLARIRKFLENTDFGTVFDFELSLPDKFIVVTSVQGRETIPIKAVF